ncbi:MAG: TetR/AcrR family transcriptional regulator [Polyangiaceae bacterium]
MPRLRTTPRKSPNQDRAKATVEAILTATAQVLVKDGYDRASTNKIAEAAGVSIGSLYQYFPSKEALVATLLERHMQDMANVFEDTFGRLGDAPLDVATRELVKAMITAHAIDPKLHRIFAEQMPRTGRLQRISELERTIADRLRLKLEMHREILKPENLDIAIFLLVQLVEAAGHGSVLDPRHAFAPDELAREISDLCLAYLLGPRPPQSVVARQTA